MKQYNVAIVGATGVVGEQMRLILESRGFPVGTLRLLASPKSAGKRLTWHRSGVLVTALAEDSFTDVDIALFSAGSDISRRYAPIARDAGAVVVDNSSAWRMEEGVPLVVPEVNPQDIRLHQGIIANPNCSTIIMVVPVWPLHQACPIRRLVIATYQAVSGAGAKAMAELEQQARDWAAGKVPARGVLPHQALFNVFSHNSKVGANGYNEEENKMVRETRKMFHSPGIRITATCVRVPVLRAHSEAINIEFSRPMSAAQAREILSRAPGVRIVDDPEKNYFPMPLDASGGDDVLVGRLRQDASQDGGTGVEMFVSGDQIRKGAALNAVQIAERL